MSQGLLDIANDLVAAARSDERANLHLNALNKLDVTVPWHLGFSCGRTLQAARLKAWGEKAESLAAAQAAFLGRARANGGSNSRRLRVSRYSGERIVSTQFGD